MPDIWFPNLGIELENVNRVFISVFGLDIYWYAIIILFGIFAALFFALREAAQTGQKKENYMDLLYVGLPSTMVGLRLFYVAFTWDNFRDNPWRIITGLREGGLAIYGGIIAAVITVYVFSRVRKMDIWLALDTCAPSFVLGQAIGRWGNFFNREAFGGFTDNLFAMRMVRDQVGLVVPEVLEHSITVHGVEYIQVHPTFLYESVWNFFIFAALTLYRPHKKFGGEVFLLYLLGYGLGRFFIEQLRTDQLLLMGTGLPVSQVLSAVLVAATVVAIPVIRFRRKQINP